MPNEIARATLPRDGNAQALGILTPDYTRGGTVEVAYRLINLLDGDEYDGAVVRIAAVGGDVYYAVNADADTAEATAFLPEGAVEYIYINRLDDGIVGFTALGINTALSTGVMNFIRMV